MVTLMRTFRTGLATVLCLSAISCGGGGTYAPPGPPPPTPGSNTVDVIVDNGPTVNGSQIGSVNTLFVTITVCVPGSTTSCQTIDHVQVDTGSFGLRILSQALTINLPVQMDASGNSLAECAVFADGYSWGPVATADFTIGGETAKALPTQIIGVSTFNAVPSDCASLAPTAEDTILAFGANGIIGVGPFAQDCPECSQMVIAGSYYSCSATTCTGTTMPLVDQVVNPVTLFATDNNGQIIQLQSVANAGAVTASGTITFGVDTQSNNVSGAQSVFNIDDQAELTMMFNGQTLDESFIDSGSNGIYFTYNLPACAGNISEFYCPSTTIAGLALTIQGVMPNGTAIPTQTTGVSFTVANAQAILNSPNSALPTLAGTLPAMFTQTFDFGLPFFYGRRVATVVEGSTTTVGTGPYVAF
jgi:hypothetical protein